MSILSIHGHSDKELIAAMQQGESWALKKMFTENQDNFKRWARRALQTDMEEIEDIYQESIIITYENIQKGKLNTLSCSLSTYLFAVAKNLLRELKRKEVKFSKEEEMIVREFYSYTSEAETIPFELLESAKQALTKMEEPCKSILTFFYYFDKSIEEIADQLGYKDKTSVKTQKSRCLKYLRETISYQW